MQELNIDPEELAEHQLDDLYEAFGSKAVFLVLPYGVKGFESQEWQKITFKLRRPRPTVKNSSGLSCSVGTSPCVSDLSRMACDQSTWIVKTELINSES